MGYRKPKTRIDENGYVRFSDSGKSFHRWVGTKKYGKNYIQDKGIHHLNGDIQNNDKSNLIAVSKEDHYLLNERLGWLRIHLFIIFLLTLFHLVSVILVNTGFTESTLYKLMFLILLDIAVVIYLFVILEHYFGIFGFIKKRFKTR